MFVRNLKLVRYDWAVFFGLFVEAFVLQLVPVILVAVSNDLGFSLEEGGFAEGGMIQFFSGITGALAMLFGTFIADKFGKRFTFTASLILLFVGVIALSFADTYLVFVIMMMIAGAGGCMLIGLAPALAHDLHEKDSGKYITIANSFWSGGMLLTVFLAGYLISNDFTWRNVVLLGSLTVIIPIIIMILPQKSGQEFPESAQVESFKETAKKKVVTLKTLSFWKFVLLIGMITCSELIIGLWTASYIQLNFNETAEAGGIAVGCFAAGMIISRFVSGHFITQDKIKGFIIGYAFFAFLLTSGIPFINSLSFLYVMLFLSGLAIAPLWPCIQSYCVDQLPQLDKTVVLILLSVAGITAYSVGSLLTGVLASAYDNLNPIYYLVPVNYLLCAVILLAGGKNRKPAEE